MAYLGRKSATATLTSADIADSTILIQDLADEVGIESTHHKVPAHADDSARDTAIPSPATGMLIYNTASGAVQQYNGVWSTIAPAPNISAVSGFLNDDSDSTITVFGTNFTATSVVKMFTASAGGTQIGSNATTTFNSSSKLTAVFGAGSIGASGSTAYIEVDNVGSTNRFATAITVNADPTVVHAGATGTGANTTTHLGTYGGLTANGGEDSNTVLLLNFDRGGGSTDFEDSSNTSRNGYKVTASADAIIKASPFGDGKSAMKFPGASNDRLAVPASDDWDFGSGNATVEFWMFCTALTASGTAQRIVSTQGSVYWYLAFDEVTSKFTLNGTNIPITHSSSTFSINTWRHVAFTKIGTALKVYVDGVQTISCTASADMGDSDDILTIGEYDGGGEPYWGYIDELRIVKGTAVYTANFTPPTSRLTAITNTKLLIHSNLAGGGSSFSGYNTFTDSNTQVTAKTITSTNVIHSTLYNHAESTVVTPAMAWPASGKAFGSTGVYLDGTGDYLTVGAGEGPFDIWSVDWWMYPTRTDTSYIFDFRDTGRTSNVRCRQEVNGAGVKIVFESGSSDTVTFDDTVIPLNAWTHVVVTQSAGSGSTLRGYFNGYYQGVGTATSHFNAGGGPFSIGKYYDSATILYQGYIDSFRWGATAYSTSTSASTWGAFSEPTSVYGASLSQTIPTITFTGSATQLAADEDIEFTAVENSGKPDDARSLIDTDLGLTLTNLTGADKHKATLTGTLASPASTTYTNMPLKLQVRKTLGDAAYANASRVVTFSGSTVTTGLAPAMPVTGTGIPAATIITSVDTSTTITLSADPTGGTLTGQSLVFEDLTRVSHQYNGSDTINNADAMYTIATGTDDDPVLFNARRYMGNTTGLRQITGFGFQPDLVWIKDRDTAGSHGIFDIVRGTNDGLFSNSSGAEDTGANYLSAFGSDGFTLGQSGTGNGNVANNLNGDNSAFIAWAWKAGGAPTGNGKRRTNDSATETTLSASGSPGTDSTLYTTGFQFVKQSVNSAGQFSITQYQSQNPVSGNYLLPHGLTGAPDFIIIKSSSNANSWHVWHDDVTTPATGYLTLDYPDAEANSASPFGNTAPSATHITLGGSGNVNYDNRTYIMYAWKAVAGVSHFGTYEGLGSAATNVVVNDMGFEPKWLLIKNIDAGSSSWLILDGFRDVGEMITGLIPNTNAADDSTTTFGTTATSTGFTMDSGTTSAYLNSSGHTFIYAAFA